MAKKTGLPEISVNSGPIVEYARAAIDARAKAAEYTTIEQTNTKGMAEEATRLRKSQLPGTYIGLIRITGEDLPATRVELRIENGALNVDELPKLDQLYGPARPLLFGKEGVVTAIVDPDKLIAGMKAKGLNPWDYLDLKVKKDMDQIVGQYPSAVTVGEAVLPKKEFLITVNDVVKTLSSDAIEYINNYLESTLKPRVVLGTAKGAK